MIDKKTLDEETRIYLRDLLDKSPEELDDYQRAFLKARIDYLTSGEKETLSEVLDKPVDEQKVREKLMGEMPKEKQEEPKVEPKEKQESPDIEKLKESVNLDEKLKKFGIKK
jgi:hypothetical protein